MKKVLLLTIMLAVLALALPRAATEGEGPRCNLRGLLGAYFNLPQDHPDMRVPTTGVVTGTRPYEKDWFSERYFRFMRNDTIRENRVRIFEFFPVNDGWAGDPNFFAVHWQGKVQVYHPGAYTFSLGSDDDSWLYLNKELVIDLGGAHNPTIATSTRSLEPGDYRIDIFYADRRVSTPVILFSVHGGEVRLSPCVPQGT